MSQNEGADKDSQGLTDIPISSQVDSTGVMPAFDSGPSVHSMSQEDAAKEWQEMTVDKEGKYDHFPRSVFLKRLSALFEHGFGERIKSEKKNREEAARRSLETQLDVIDERESLEALAKAKQGAEFYFGSEGKAQKAISVAQDVLTEIGSEADLDFLDSTGLGNSPQIIQMLVNFSDHPELYADLKKIGIKNLIRIGDVALRRKK